MTVPRRRKLAALTVLVTSGLLGPAHGALACGSSGPGGVSACSLADYSEETRPRWRLGLSTVYTSTVMSFGGGLQAGETRFASLAEVSYAPTARLSLALGLGGAAGGRLLAPDGPHDFSPGLVSNIGVAYRFLDGQTPIGRGFVVGNAGLSFTASSTQLHDTGPSTSYDALDLRVGVSAGFTWGRAFSAYGLARAFGGPAYWAYGGQSQVGTDTHHYQFGAGLALLVARKLDLYVEGVPLGEQAVAAGASVSF